MPNDVLLAPSILAADYAVLADQTALVRAHSDWLHVDLMDGHFVPNLSIGPPVVASLRRHTDLFLDCHLMASDPGMWLEPLAKAGANLCSVHVELGDPTRSLARTRELGMQAGVVIDGPTAFEAVEPYLDERIDLLLVMTIKAGFGGQAFMPEHLEKVRRARELRDGRALGFRIQVDGGINVQTAKDAVAAGADVLVAGTAIFGAPKPTDAAKAIRAAAGLG
ncbi:MAG TPA: ribulose-phosphate 3-epimerase [Actinomycetota bacterium]|nr:ribulose-phosphate 3-epimerase [Actinomycetota bacterium]